MSQETRNEFVLLPELDTELEEFAHRLDRDFLVAATSLTGNQLRVLVHNYHEIQRLRISLSNAALAMERNGQPTDFVRTLAKELKKLESSITRVMNDWIQEYPVAEWALRQVGVGPVTVATLLAYIDVERCRTAGAVWRYCGLDPTITHTKGQPTPYNRRLKRICYVLGDTFRKRSKDPNCFYGRIYRLRKEYEVERNERGEYADQARARLEEAERRRYRIAASQREAWSQGKLTAAHIDLRARRYAVKLFLSHFAWVYWETEKGEPWPLPYPVAFLGHVDVIEPPSYTPLPRASAA
jgi:hypothetical protein